MADLRDNHFVAFILDIVFPKRCPVCDRVLEFRGKAICGRCGRKLLLIGSKGCRKCGRLLRKSEDEYCKDCMTVSHTFDAGLSAFVYNDAMKRSIYRFKNGGRQEYAGFYADAILRNYERQIRSFGADAIVAVPLHKEKMYRRGYNQAELIAKELSKKLDIPLEKDLIKRKNRAVAQKTLDASKRRKNLKKAFIIKGNDVKLKRVIIVDDVYTTGSTMDELSLVLKRHGIEKVLALTVASGTPV